MVGWSNLAWFSLCLFTFMAGFFIFSFGAGGDNDDDGCFIIFLLCYDGMDGGCMINDIVEWKGME